MNPISISHLRRVEAATQLLMARDALASAQSSILSAAESTDDDTWEFAREATALQKQVDELRNRVYFSITHPNSGVKF